MTVLDPIPEVVDSIARGQMVVIVDDEDRENEADLVIAADAVTADAVNFMIRMARGLVCTALTPERVRHLDLPMMPARGRQALPTAFTVSVDAADVTTGISAEERAHTIGLLADEHARPDDFVTPGHVFPLRARAGGVLERPGHTEAAVELARLAGRTPAGAICEIIGRDGRMLRSGDARRFAGKFGLKMSSVELLKRYLTSNSGVIEDAVTRFPTRYGLFTLHSFLDEIGGECHLALTQSSAGVRPLVRVHSECLTGDAFGSLRCDCGDQLATALEQIANRGAGALIYLRQEGRGIGLKHKIRAYQLQDQGLDTVDANVAQGLPADARSYRVAARMLQQLGLDSVDLLTNNPGKCRELSDYGIEIHEVLPIGGQATMYNRTYLNTKRTRMGHTLREE